MRIGVGSGNPVKRRAVEAALTSADAPLAPAADLSVDAVAVESGVSEQPRGHDETITGAETRAANALAAGDYDLGIGIEGGVATFDGTDGLFLIMWAAVTDGDRDGRAAGPSYRLPESIATRVRDGEELGPVMDDVLGESDVAKKQGAAGALTGGRVDREDALASAVAGALGPFATELYESADAN